jgi:hypothetical protein
MMTSTARVATELPRRYLGQLCKHFEHKLPVVLELPEGAAAWGRIQFSSGVCELSTEDGALIMRIAAEDAEGLARTEGVVARHLLRFAFRDPPAINWTP